jgi:calpain-15
MKERNIKLEKENQNRRKNDGSQFPIQWKRSTQFMNTKIMRVFLGSISPHDIQQGRLGDCWFLSVLSALSEFPRLIKDLFLDDFSKHTAAEEKIGYSPLGLYHMRFFKNGLETTVRVDDYFPCTPGCYSGPVYSRSNGDELWVLLAEKAFAKLHGSYAAIVSGYTAEALMDLTGAPTKKLLFSNEVTKQMVRRFIYNYCFIDIYLLDMTTDCIRRVMAIVTSI